jgi:NADPH:quinone reductase-like Zn-dependent oxidoreductase
MRAFTLDGFESTPGLRDDLPVPSAGAGELLVRVHASSVNPADAAIASGMLKGMAEYEFPVTPRARLRRSRRGSGIGRHSLRGRR